ncbi:hypothetical protein RFI_02406 [Reticulomyxa filosa]|uniref:Uncharacterized protein n=1 Tax=Reticulomyxa filosa TaxID=46433 RepID=X6P9D8_RETFI|nr:hypothetical protein RFI_02406 [Reticulomyxa filosa]|eukprot:ETO34684.1 hypothetical protein RFI_02406 [Reticulomyxa filosa]
MLFTYRNVIDSTYRLYAYSRLYQHLLDQNILGRCAKNNVNDFQHICVQKTHIKKHLTKDHLTWFSIASEIRSKEDMDHSSVFHYPYIVLDIRKKKRIKTYAHNINKSNKIRRACDLSNLIGGNATIHTQKLKQVKIFVKDDKIIRNTRFVSINKSI